MKMMIQKDWNKTSKKVDARKLKNGMYRLRFRLTDSALGIVESAMTLARSKHGCKYKNWELDIVAMNYLSGCPEDPQLPCPANGRNRFLVRLFPDQFETIRLALDEGLKHSSTDSEALLLIAKYFLESEDDSLQTSSCKYLHSTFDTEFDTPNRGNPRS